MTSIYTPAGPSVAGNKITATQLINSPVLVQKSLSSIVRKRLVSGILLAGRLDVTGSGSAVFEGEGNIFANEEGEIVDDLAEYPLTSAPDTELSVYTVDKYGLAIDIPGKYIARNRIDLIQRRMLQMANRVVYGFDGRGMSAIASAVTQTQPAAAAWDSGSANQMLDVLLADAKIEDAEKGFEGNVVALRPTYWAQLASSTKVLEHAAAAGDSNPIVSGNFFKFAGKTFVKAPRLKVGVNVMVADANALGTIMWEDQGGGYDGDPSDVFGVESKVIPLEKQDGVRIQVRKAQEPVIVEPEAAVELTGV